MSDIAGEVTLTPSRAEIEAEYVVPCVSEVDAKGAADIAL
jgi:hypothetical protein